MKTITTLFALLLFVFTIHAQERIIQWQKTIGGSGDDNLTIMIETDDGGFLASGTSDSDISGEKTEDSRGLNDYWILKIDENGNIEWQKTYGGSDTEVLSSALQTTDGGYILGGFSSSNISGEKTEDSYGFGDFWALKLDSAGAIEWQKTIGGIGQDAIYSIVETDDGGYMLAGDSASPISGNRTAPQIGFHDILLVKLDAAGAIEWQNSFGSGLETRWSKLEKTNDGGFIISATKWGITSTHEGFLIIKIDASGNQVWDKIIQGNKSDWLSKTKQTSDGGYIVAGISNSDAVADKTENAINGSMDYWILKLDENGNIVWQNTIGGDASEGNVNAIDQTEDGGYLVQGYSNSNISGDKTENSNGELDFWFVKINSIGIIEWQNTIGGEGNEYGGSSIQTTDGDFITAGSSNSNISGDKTENSRGGYDYWIIKHDSTLGVGENTFATTMSIYPNPVSNILQINTQDITINQINIYSVLGSRVRQLDVEAVSPTVDVSSLASGVYYVQLYSGKNVALKKFVKE
ncbi:T9SS type A sorting domain-containing protein [Aequorivita antarctica]|uniref:T9SS type A sorting domain-containing protein n=1 Tax=Aequorivita antarctica TaxID=153266 RepID=A0A5C6Z543_9FLAO|nr:T9SS type A sorting domain-containing protein [Aequorivita antarctica]TXD74998.1 T9SS type A sorting domain-containing protein [Aequorivita antarctica]SRX72273.1 hypothetical protein AEQU3_00105 [Aequorivita antarctica]